MKKVFFTLFLLTGVAHADSAIDSFKHANDAYIAGKFSDAVPLYQGALDGGLKNWVVYYDLGNAYYKSEQLGKAVASYARAFRLHSGDSDVIYNLNLASTKAGDAVLPAGALPALGWQLFYFFSLNTLALWTSGLFFALCGLAGWALLGRRASGDLAIFIGIAFVGSSVWLGLRTYIIREPQGVVVVTTAEIRSGPNTTYPTNFTVPEGHRVLILDEEEPVAGWLEIGVPDQGLKGWVPQAQIDVL